MKIFQSTLDQKNRGRPPVWMMRQAGRYHSHYQGLRKKYSFIDLCKRPEVACEATLGPIRDFDFDAAILFSDLLFPLEVMGMGLSYPEGPQLEWYLREKSDLNRLQSGARLADQLEFQSDAIQLIRKALPPEKALLGFVGGPVTLFCYAVEGSHQGDLESARRGIKDGRFLGFFEKLVDLLVENMVLQAQAGADAIAILDTCAGEFDPTIFKRWIVPMLSRVMKDFKQRLPDTRLVYYSKGTGPDHWAELKGLPISCLGIDWNHDLVGTLTEWGSQWAIQGNIDPNWLCLERRELEIRLRRIFHSVRNLPVQFRQGWVCGLGHGVLPKTPEENIRLFLRLQKEIFSEKTGDSQ